MAVTGKSAVPGKILAGLALAGGIGVLGALTPAVAAAQPAGPGLLSTSCNANQVEAALHAHAPDLAARLDAHPLLKAHLEHLLNMPPDQREQRLGELRERHPELGQWRRSHHPDVDPEAVRAELQQVLDTCSTY
ncbi:hemophore-related protein [Nocardia sp. alder85J]|uniref:hemophore-related protein n=1 Tax=Nocardia sp. alder85J TaxID=2862949 RepID=UPI001CD20344|nr:hemophore-related protein [Nocardia sp. alder85J]MCX4096880.1 hemophore-related protein [Nocardia sp. alder85J]